MTYSIVSTWTKLKMLHGEKLGGLKVRIDEFAEWCQWHDLRGIKILQSYKFLWLQVYMSSNIFKYIRLERRYDAMSGTEALAGGGWDTKEKVDTGERCSSQCRTVCRGTYATQHYRPWMHNSKKKSLNWKDLKKVDCGFSLGRGQRIKVVI